MSFPINIDDLISRRTVESERKYFRTAMSFHVDYKTDHEHEKQIKPE